MGAIARRLEPASAAINAMTIPLRIQPVRCMACELMLMFTLLDIMARRGRRGVIELAASATAPAAWRRPSADDRDHDCRDYEQATEISLPCWSERNWA